MAPCVESHQAVNTHPMVTRAKDGLYKPRVYIAIVEPELVSEALASQDWRAAMNEEYLALMRNYTGCLTKFPFDRKAIGSKWVFKLKQNADGTLNRYKAGLVARGYGETAGLDYNETFSPVAKPTVIRIILTVALSQAWPIRQLDVNNAFLNRDLE